MQENASQYYWTGSIRDHYQITDIVIGQGSYAVVKLGYSIDDSKLSASSESSHINKVAIKIYNKRILKNQQKKGSLDNEIMTLKMYVLLMNL